MNKIRAAVVGAGIYGKHHMNAYRHNPDTVLVATQNAVTTLPWPTA